jgi:sulfur carrier protein
MESPKSTIQLKVNGKQMSLPSPATLSDLVKIMRLDSRYLVVEHNGEPRRRESFASTILREGDRLELVRPVAGG